MTRENERLSWPLAKSSNWVLANTDSLSYVKVLYDAKNYAELALQLRIDHTQKDCEHLDRRNWALSRRRQQSHPASKQCKAVCRQIGKEEADRTGLGVAGSSVVKS
ncbi:hypothetical protein KIN20_027434 [Parelaphostrongylus tenuis]|uniref:Uncharacterized protein n=1 Tax=Parelaphostrongylus tenuis TaxID=148309 RepID=A0AAD5QZB4_PARTN|nr:hypothetical protein KIN20_027434 [Parelaphostrongylus tenuis]